MASIKQAKQTATIFRKCIKDYGLEKTCSLLPDLYVQAVTAGNQKKQNTDGLLATYLIMLMDAHGKVLTAKLKAISSKPSTQEF